MHKHLMSFAIPFGVAILAACGGTNNALSPTSSTLDATSWRSAASNAIKQIKIQKRSCCDIAVDPALNQVYVSSGGHLHGNHTTVVDGSSFSIIATVDRFGGAYNVDSKTHNIWLPGLYRGDAEVYSGITKQEVTTVSLGACPVSAWVDGKRRQAWIAAQCGAGSDPVWAVDADTYAVVAGPIRTGGVMGLTMLNPATGRFYVNNSSGNFKINPVTFKLSATSFGLALGADAVTNVLYAQAPNGLNIVSGSSEKIETTVPLSYTPGSIGVNGHLNHIYLSAGQNSIEVRDGTTGTLLRTIQLATGISIVSLGADPTDARIYTTGIAGAAYYLYAVKDD